MNKHTPSPSQPIPVVTMRTEAERRLVEALAEGAWRIAKERTRG